MPHRYRNIHRPSILDNQNIHARSNTRKIALPRKKKSPLGIITAVSVALLFFFCLVESTSLSSISPEYHQKGSAHYQGIKYDRSRIAHLIRSRMGKHGIASNFTVTDTDGRELSVKTYLQPKIQNILNGLLESSKAAGGAIVVIDPRDGRVIGLSEKGLGKQPPLNLQTLPAASVFKIITAASALEKTELGPSSKIPYNGRKYTLYRSNLSRKITKYTHYVTLKDAFALSINPVFGKIGIYHVGGKELTEFGEKFGFNRSIPSDIPVPTSCLQPPETDFQIAEMASGFNKTTLLSPLHAAWISQTIWKNGDAHSLAVVESIKDADGNSIYTYEPAKLGKIISEQTSEILLDMMRSTVLKGTARKSFKKYHKEISKGEINVGGKTGNINNRQNTIKYDWFVGYCEYTAYSHPIVFSVVLLHHKTIGLRAHRVARLFLERYFNL